MPFYFSYNSKASKAVSFIGKVGPQISFLTNSKLDDNNGNKINGDTKNRYKDVTFGGMVSAGAQYKLQSDLYLITAVRFDYDLPMLKMMHTPAILQEEQKHTTQH